MSGIFGIDPRTHIYKVSVTQQDGAIFAPVHVVDKGWLVTRVQVFNDPSAPEVKIIVKGSPDEIPVEPGGSLCLSPEGAQHEYIGFDGTGHLKFLMLIEYWLPTPPTAFGGV